MSSDQATVDFGWVMQVTFVMTIIIGAPAVAVASLFFSLPTWPDRAEFAIRVGALVWLVTALSVYGYARTHDVTGEYAADDDSEETE